jgi:excisionase family DNA binding protein
MQMLTVGDAETALKVGRTTVFRLIRTGELASVRIGRSRRIPAEALEQYLARLTDGAGEVG